MLVRSKAPLRISFGGGGTDVSPYAEERGGATLVATIDKYAYCSLTTRTDDIISLKSLDYDFAASFNVKDKLDFDGNLDLVKSALRVMHVDEGIDILLHSDMPPGSGLGSSSAISVSLVGAARHLKKWPISGYETAELAYRIERQELGIRGGKQDQYAATFGGFNFIEFFGDRVIVNPLRVSRDTVNELQYRLLLCFTGNTRRSDKIIEDQMHRYVSRQGDTASALDKTKELAMQMKNALLLDRIDEFGHLLDEAWEAKKAFTPQISNPTIDNMYNVAKTAGAIGGKLLGAGGGGCLLFLCDGENRYLVARALEEIGAKTMQFAFEYEGLRTWLVINRE
jgi:D-glycero-alpha-D-manno-heptose-7-phosphate kinase